ncbi:class I SAM-dependent methyltransferase [Planctomicrobium piriforme]|uniref:O-Methyltransferase involved in polyketide biosynthesis n=1 Tax=Planctomicrobium piriforme TaxID=1576369 RepID=A0A1I3MIL7_9PLAN|nr:class I SAM-dependent methyltransferase [Planctomicrobium piriforme]SFI96565.1 O-Methyltransferase involved in polyketide biosynthesis [Planctomicrobium piriforme]
MTELRLQNVQQTPLITLSAKARESRLADSLLHDHFAAAAIERLDADLTRFQVWRDGMIGLAVRAKTLDDWTTEFLAAHSESVVLHLGCGLDSRILRVNPNPSVRWFDIDLPEVIQLRRSLYPSRVGQTLISASLTEPGHTWLSEVPSDRPTLIVAEGVFPYLTADDVQALLNALLAHLPSGELIFDAYSQLCLKLIGYHSSIRSTGAMLRWGIDDPHELETWNPRLRLVTDLTDHDPQQLARLSWPSRLLTRIPALKRLARLLRYSI